jgi:alpha-L-rhamnosidase
MHGIPEDCPHREKCGWLGDAHAFCEYALYNYELLNFYKKYMEDIRTQMRPVAGNKDPEPKYMVPTMIAPGKRTSSIAKLDWGIATMYLPWYNYLYYGDSAIVLDYYGEMKELTEYYLSFKDQDGIIQNGMGDWCPPRWDRRLNPGAMECPPVVSANAYFYDILGIMEVFAQMNKDTEFEARMQAEKKQLFEAFNKEYLATVPNSEFLWYGSQTATVQALQFGIVPEEKLDLVVKGLEHDILHNKGGHHSTGIHGNRYIYTVLSKYGKEELAYEILTTPKFPSQAYILDNGFTTWPERQFEWDKAEKFTNSLNHPMHSGFAALFFESFGGIKTGHNTPGYKEFVVDPIFPKAITNVDLRIPTPFGQVHNNWEIEDSKLTMELSVPFNTRARLRLTEEELKTLIINGQKFTGEHNEINDCEDYNKEVILGSGTYSLAYKKLN